MTSISELKRDGIGSPIELRIIRKWRHDVRRYETWFLGVDRFILGQRTNQSYIESVLNVSECYTISKYSCPELDKYQKVLENNFYKDVGLSSVIKPLANTITIPATWFRFASKSQLTELGEHPSYYLDFIGMVSKIRDCTKHDGQPTGDKIISESFRGNEVPINIWKECFTNPMKFSRSLIIPPPAMTVVAVTNLKPSLSRGTLRHGSSHATHVYVNPQIPETIELMNLYSGPYRPLTTPSGIPANLKEIREKSRSQLLDKTFLVKASIADIVFQDKWCQMICPTCRDPIFKRGTKWYCGAHSKIEKPILTHKFHVTISDPTATMSAVISKTSFRKLINSDSEHTVDDNIALDRKTLPVVIKIPVTSQPSAVPATPSQPPLTRSALEHNPPMSDTTRGQTARTLTFTTNDEPMPSADVKRARKK
ncbi:unnamed protein product [Lactuca saligna]|uniref:Uncharacterized protein n=1 Tax=Lactuca saligna TaxID=75948 RepID=A0AA35Y3X6_LACSI|nr:unnamed protein product [Lactuca saligna]